MIDNRAKAAIIETIESLSYSRDPYFLAESQIPERDHALWCGALDYALAVLCDSLRRHAVDIDPQLELELPELEGVTPWPTNAP